MKHIDSIMLDVIRLLAPYSVTVQQQAWHPRHEEWLPLARFEEHELVGAERQWICYWGAKLGHFTTGATLEECLHGATTRFAEGTPGAKSP